MVARMQAVMPPTWFPDDAVILPGLLSGVGWLFAQCYACLAYVRQQTRIATATEGNVDLIAQDFTGTGIRRLAGETDDHLRARVLRAIFQERDTRNALVHVLQTLTGYAPVIFNPGLVSDAAHYGPEADSQVAACDTVGAYGSRVMPFQVLVTAFRPANPAQASDEDIRQAILSVKSAGSVIWMRIADAAPVNTPRIDVDFDLDESALS